MHRETGKENGGRVVGAQPEEECTKQKVKEKTRPRPTVSH